MKKFIDYNKEPDDMDFVITGADDEYMTSRGFYRINQNFPVYTHDVYKDEFALARKELKVGNGHGGFECETDGVTIEEDLHRRDLTICAMAVCLGSFDEWLNGNYPNIDMKQPLVDPCGGLEDIMNRKVRPVGRHFGEDPLRLMRAARFLGNYEKYGFTPTPELIKGCFDIANSGDLDNLDGSRFWGEIKKLDRTPEAMKTFISFTCKFPIAFSEPFRRMGYTREGNIHHPENDVLEHTFMALTKLKDYNVKTMMGVLCHDFGKTITYPKYGNGNGHDEAGVPMIKEWCLKHGVPKDVREFCMGVSKYHTVVHGMLGRGGTITCSETIQRILSTNFFGKYVKEMADVCQADARGRGKLVSEKERFDKQEYNQGKFIIAVVEAFRSMDNRAAIEQHPFKEPKDAINHEQRMVVAKELNNFDDVTALRKHGTKAVWELLLVQTKGLMAETFVDVLIESGVITGHVGDLECMRRYMLRNELSYEEFKKPIDTFMPFYSNEIRTMLGDLK